MVSSVSSNQHNKVRTCVGNTAGVAAGLAAPVVIVSDYFRKWTPEMASNYAACMKKLMLDVDTFENTKKVAQKIVEESGLKKKGIKLAFIDGSKESLEHLKNVCANEVKPKTALGRRLLNTYTQMFGKGANAAFFQTSNECIVHSKNLYTSVYHELGHAMNANGNWLTKGLQRARGLTPLGASIVAPFALGVALFHKVDNTKPKEQKGIVEKSLDFVANNAATITAASYVPMLAEDGLASIRGLKAVKPHLGKNMTLKLAKNYTVAFGTYAIAAIGVSLGVKCGIWLANKIKNPKNTEPKSV